MSAGFVEVMQGGMMTIHPFPIVIPGAGLLAAVIMWVGYADMWMAMGLG